jgi:S1-C subfamily serine protease
MPIRVICPSCSRIGKAPDQVVGRTVRCPACKHSYVVTNEHIQPDDGYGLDPAAEPRAAQADDSYGLDPASIAPPKQPAVRRPIAPIPADEEESDDEGGHALPVPAIVGGGIGVAVLLAAVVAWGLGMFGGRAPVADAPDQNLATQAPALATSLKDALEAQAKPAPAGATTGEISVAAMLVLDQPSPEEPVAEPEVAKKARSGAASVAASEVEAGKALSTAEIAEESEPSVALIKGKGSSGTGFLVGPGLVATNAHVIDDEFATDLEVRFVSADDGQNSPIKGVLLYEDAERDLAFLAVETSLKPLRIAKSYTFKKGEDVTVIGNPGIGDGQVLENAISRGVMSTKAKVNNKDFYQLNIAINPGNSGGPVFDSTGRVIGVATLKSMKQEATGFCIPTEDLQAAIAKVGSQSSADADQCRSKHRSKVAAKTLGGAGALMCLMIDLRKIDAQTKNPAVKEVLAKLEPAVDSFEKEITPTLTIESQLSRNDATLNPTVRNLLGEITDNFEKLRSAVATRKYPDAGQLTKLKQNHRRLITGLSTALKIEFPKEMMVAFEDHSPSQPNIVTMAPSNLGSRFQSRPPANNGPSRPSGAPGRSQTLRDRMQQRRNGGR